MNIDGIIYRCSNDRKKQQHQSPFIHTANNPAGSSSLPDFLPSVLGRPGFGHPDSQLLKTFMFETFDSLDMCDILEEKMQYSRHLKRTTDVYFCALVSHIFSNKRCSSGSRNKHEVDHAANTKWLNMISYIQVEPGKPRAEVSKKKNYKPKKEFAYRMCTG